MHNFRIINGDMAMIALVMCGGKGSRIGFKEKPMIKIGERLIDHAIRELTIAKIDSVFITSPYTPMTEKYLRSIGLEVYRAKGRGYIEDLFEFIKVSGIEDDILTLNSDLYYFTKGIVNDFCKHYASIEERALSACYPDGRRVGINAFQPIINRDEELEEAFYFLTTYDVINVDTLDDLRMIKWRKMNTLKRENGW